MDYAQKLASDTIKYLDRLKQSIDEDIVNLQNLDLIRSLTLAEADTFLDRTASVLDLYRQSMSALYRNKVRPRIYTSGYSSSTGNAGRRSRIEDIAVEAMNRDGYLVESQFATNYGFNLNAVRRKFGELTLKYSWRREKSNEGWRYVPSVVAESPPVKVEEEISPENHPEVPPAEIQEPVLSEAPVKKSQRKSKRATKERQETTDQGSTQ